MPFQPTNQGYDPLVGLKKTPPRGVNGYLKSLLDGSEKNLWVNEVSVDYAMSGTSGQSYATRSYFPHNLEAVSLKVSCEFPNQVLYADVVEYIRSFHVNYSSSMLLQIINRSANHNQALKGGHSNISAEGYVNSVKRVHERWIKAPTLQFEFIVERFLEPTDWAGTSVKIRSLRTWKDIIEEKKPGFVTDPDKVIAAPPRNPSVQEQGNQVADAIKDLF